MRTHGAIDNRSLALARAIAAKIDADPAHSGLERARAVCRRWYAKEPTETYREWLVILSKPWSEVRKVLVDESELGQRLRQSAPFCGILTPRERWDIYRSYARS